MIWKHTIPEDFPDQTKDKDTLPALVEKLCKSTRKGGHFAATQTSLDEWEGSHKGILDITLIPEPIRKHLFELLKCGWEEVATDTHVDLPYSSDDQMPQGAEHQWKMR